VVPNTARADELFAKIAADEPFALEDSTGVGTVADPNAPVLPPAVTPEPPDTADPAAPALPTTPTAEVIPGLNGQTAADKTCSKSNN